jgi:O-antigen/teichoic acid export membrane protein
LSTFTSPLYKNSLATIIIRGSVGAVRFVAFMLIAREYGPVAFGEFALAFSIVEIARILGEFGFDTVLVRRIAAEPGRVEKVMNNAIAFKLVSAVCVSLLALLVFAALYGQSGMHLLAVFIPSIFVALTSNTLVAYFQARLKMAEIVAPYVVSAGCYLGLTLAFLVWHAPLTIVASAFTIGEFIALLLVFGRIRVYLPIQVENDVGFIKELVKEASFVALSSFIVVVYLRLDALLIGTLLGSRAVGEYSLAFRLTEPFQLLFSSLSLSLFASLSRLWQSAELVEVWRTIRKVLYPTVGVAGVSIVLLSMVVSPLLKSYAPEFIQSQDVLIVLSIALLFKAVNPQLTAILNSLGEFRLITMITFVNLLMCVFLNSILIPRYGVVGAALAVAGVEGLNSLIQWCAAWIVIRKRVKPVALVRSL